VVSYDCDQHHAKTGDAALTYKSLKLGGYIERTTLCLTTPLISYKPVSIT